MAKTSVFLAGGEAFTASAPREAPTGLSPFDKITWLKGYDARQELARIRKAVSA